MCKAEAEVRPGANSLANHGVEFGGPTGYIDGKMRGIAVSWLVEVTSEFDMHQETLFLAVNLLDRFLSLTKVRLHTLPKSVLRAAYGRQTWFTVMLLPRWNCPKLQRRLQGSQAVRERSLEADTGLCCVTRDNALGSHGEAPCIEAAGT